MEYEESCSRPHETRATICSKSDAQRFQGCFCCLCDIDQPHSQNEVPLSDGHVVCILSVIFTVELEARQSHKSKPVRISDLHVQHHFMAKPQRKQFRCRSDAVAPLLGTSRFLCVLRLSSGSVDHCSRLFQWARILFVLATERRQESLLVESETWQIKLDTGT